MRNKLGIRIAALVAIVCITLTGQAILASSAGAVTASKDQLRGGEFRIEGQSTPGVFVIATSTTSIAGVRAAPNGLFKIRASDFTAPDCQITIRDGRTPTATVTLDGCTPSVTPVPQPPATSQPAAAPPPPLNWRSRSRSGTPRADELRHDWRATRRSTAARPALRWSGQFVAGSIPTGMTEPQLSRNDGWAHHRDTEHPGDLRIPPCR